jgi:hypothetical protein
MVLGMIYGLIYLIIILDLDEEIHRMCEKMAFVIRSSRKYKFYLFFFCIGAFIVLSIYFNAELTDWRMPENWFVNAEVIFS